MAAKKKGARKKGARKKAGAKKSPTITISGSKPRKGERMTTGAGWRLATTKGTKRIFVGTLVDTVNKGDVRLAIFSVPK
jgi:hypothetical protein